MTGKEALGNATILGGAINPLQVYMQQTAARDRQRAEEYKIAVKQRNDLMDDLEKHSPDKVWDPFYGEINQMTTQHVRDYARRALDSGVPVSRIRQELGKRWGDINTEVSRANMHKQTYFEAMKTLKDKNNVYDPKAVEALRNVFFDGPNARKIQDINVDKIQAEVLDNPDNFNVNGVAAQFMKNLPTKINQYYTDMFNPLGKQYNIQETQSKLGLETDANGNVVMDPRGFPKIGTITDDVFLQAKQDPYLSKLMDRDVANKPVEEQKEYLKGILQGFDPAVVKNRVQMGFKNTNDQKPKNFIFGGYGYQKTEKELEERDQMLTRVVNGNSSDIGYFRNLGKDFNIEFAKQDDKANKGKFLKVSYVRNVPNPMTGYSKELQVQYLPINTDQQKEQAKIALSTQMDAMDKKNSYGQEYPMYINEKNKNKKPAPSLNATQLLKKKAAPLK